MRVDSDRSAQIARMLRLALPASITPSPKPLRVGTCLTLPGSCSSARRIAATPSSALAIGGQPFAFGLQFAQRDVGLLFIGRLAVPGVITFHITDALAGHR